VPPAVENVLLNTIRFPLILLYHVFVLVCALQHPTPRCTIISCGTASLVTASVFFAAA
jgi:hypothetical protein